MTRGVYNTIRAFCRESLNRLSIDKSTVRALFWRSCREVYAKFHTDISRHFSRISIDCLTHFNLYAGNSPRTQYIHTLVGASIHKSA